MIDTDSKRALSVFYILLTCYQILMVFKMIAISLDEYSGIVLFYLSSFIQIFFGLSFAFVHTNTKLISLKSKKSK